MCISEVRLVNFLAFTEPGDQDWSWRSQFKWLEEHHHAKLLALLEDIWLEGQKVPVLVGDDFRVWDGHHRIYCLVDLGYDTIKVKSPCENCWDPDVEGKGMVKATFENFAENM